MLYLEATMSWLWENQHKWNRLLGELSVLWLQSPGTEIQDNLELTPINE